MSLMMKCEEIINQLLNQTNKPSELEIVEIIINSIVAVCTVWALITAIKANKQNKEEIEEVREATKQSLRMHEQSKSLQLMDMRIQLLDEVEKCEAPRYNPNTIPTKKDGVKCNIPINKFKIYYNQTTIIKAFNNLKRCYDDIDRLSDNLLYFYRKTCKPDGEGGFISPVWIEILKYIDQQGQPDYCVNADNQFKEFCLKNAYSEPNPLTNKPYEYNFYNLSQELDIAIKEFDDAKTVLLLQMREFIDESIKPIER